MKKKKLFLPLCSLFLGFANGFFGAGGGMIAVPMLSAAGLDKKDAHRNAVAVILPVTLLSAAVYILRGYVSVSDCLPFVPGGLLGAALGTLCLKKISKTVLKKIFGGFMVYAGVRLLLK